MLLLYIHFFILCSDKCNDHDMTNVTSPKLYTQTTPISNPERLSINITNHKLLSEYKVY